MSANEEEETKVQVRAYGVHVVYNMVVEHGS